MADMRHGFSHFRLLNIFVVYGQKHQVVGPCGYSFFLSQNESNTLRPELSRLGEMFCFATKPHHLHHLFSSNAAKYVIKWFSKAECNSTSGR